MGKVLGEDVFEARKKLNEGRREWSLGDGAYWRLGFGRIWDEGTVFGGHTTRRRRVEGGSNFGGILRGVNGDRGRKLVMGRLEQDVLGLQAVRVSQV